MGIFSAILLVIFIISALLLVIVVLIQDEQGEGIGGIFGGGSSTPIGNRSGNILTRTTSILAAVFLMASFGLAWLNRTPEAGNIEAAARKLDATKTGQVEWWNTPAQPSGTTDSQSASGTDAATTVDSGTVTAGTASNASSTSAGSTSKNGQAQQSGNTQSTNTSQ